MSKASGRKWKDAGAVDMTELAADTSTIRPDIPKEQWVSDVSHQEVPSPLGTIEYRITTRTERCQETGQLCDFAVVLTETTHHLNTDVETHRVDTSDGTAHYHDPTGDHLIELIPMDCRIDIDKAFLWALDYIWAKSC